MGLQLPGELTTFLNIIGYRWPQGDETKLFEIGQKWMKFANTVKQISDGSNQAAQPVWQQNQGQDISAFQNHFGHNEGPVKILGDSSTASTVLGAGMAICGAIVLALKIQMIVQLVTLAIQTAQAIAMAPPTFGASLAEIPIFQQICRTLVGRLIDQVIGQLLNA
jgi:hypothetical protein